MIGLAGQALDKVWQWDKDLPTTMWCPFTPSRRTAQRSFALPLCDLLVLMVLAILAVTCAVPEEFQNTAALPSPSVWSSEDGDVNDEITNAELFPFNDSLFQQDQRFTAVLVRSKHFCASVMRDWHLAAHMRVGTRGPPTRRGPNVHHISRPCSTPSISGSVSPARRRNDDLPRYEYACRPEKTEQEAKGLA